MRGRECDQDERESSIGNEGKRDREKETERMCSNGCVLLLECVCMCVCVQAEKERERERRKN